jgi:hypothetical protein
MNKKAAAPMIIGCALVFIVATFLFYTHYDEKRTPGNNEYFIGEEQFKVIKTYEEGEEILNFLEIAAQLSTTKASEDPGNFDSSFLDQFELYLNSCNSLYGTSIKKDDFTITFVNSNEILVKSITPITLEKENFEYEFYPNLRVNF